MKSVLKIFDYISYFCPYWTETLVLAINNFLN